MSLTRKSIISIQDALQCTMYEAIALYRLTSRYPHIHITKEISGIKNELNCTIDEAIALFETEQEFTR
jgi:hypothetical protein